MSYLHKHQQGLVICSTLVLFVVLAWCSIRHHEMWRDELGVWSITRDNSWSGIFQHARIGGHPALWFLAVKTIHLFTANPMGMQLLNLAFMAAAIWLMLQYAPFTLYHKVLAAFSYYFFYEYTTICRDYGLGFFFLTVFLSLYRHRQHYAAWMGITLALMMNTHILFLLFAMMLAGYWISDMVITDHKAIINSFKSSKYLSALGFIIVGMALYYLHARPDPNFQFIQGKSIPASLASFQRYFVPAALPLIFKTIAPMPELKMEFWNTYLFSGKWSLPLSLAVIILLNISLVRLHKRRLALFYSIAVAGFLLFFSAIYFGYIRHHSFLYLIFFAVLWILGLELEELSVHHISAPRRWVNLLNGRWSLLTLACVVQFGAAIAAISMDWKYPFSANKQAVDYLIDNELDQELWVGDEDYIVAPISAWTGKKIYYPVTGQWGSYVKWNAPRQNIGWLQKKDLERQERFIVAEAKRISMDAKQAVILILSYPVALQPLAQFTLAITNEKYYLYKIDHTLSFN